tara:strand:- start:1623 stop:1967 length:345 start_codon:yes stop_codon:yes gene_type:complete
MINQKQLLKQIETYAAKCDQALIDWQKGEPLEMGDNCTIHKGRKYYEIIRGRKGHCCHMGYVEIATGNLCKEQRQAARWNLLNYTDANLLFANVRPFGHHLYANEAKKIRGAQK